MIHILRAAPDDAPLLSEIAFAAKAHWGYPPDWMAEWRTVFTIPADYLRDHEVYKAISDASPPRMERDAQDMTKAIGFYALEGRGETLTLEHLWVLPAWIGRGVGKALFVDAVARAKASGARRLEWESDPNAEGFYLRMGAHRIGERRADMDDKPRILPRMRLEIA